MAIGLFAKPGILSWTGNSIHYLFVYSLLPVNTRLQVQLLNSGGTLVTEVLYPLATAGSLYVPLHELISPLTQHGRPAAPAISGSGSEAFTEDLQSIIGYRMQYRLVYTGSPVSYTVEVPLKAIRGGIGDMNYNSEVSINTYVGAVPPTLLPRGRNWLTWVPEGRSLRPDAYSWLTWLCTGGNVYAVNYRVKYLDGTTAGFTRVLDPLNTNYLYRKFYIPVGIMQARLDPTGKGVAYYDVRIIDPDGMPLLSYRINADNLPRYDAMTLYYRNSVGGWDDIALNGSIEKTADAERSEYEANRYFNLNGATNIYASSIRPRWKGNTGYLSREHCTALLDLLNSSECALLHRGKWLPVKMLTKSLSYVDTKDSLQSVALEFEAAGSFTSFPSQLTTLL